MRTRLVSGAVLVAATASIFLGSGCVDDDPIVTGKRADAGSEGGATALTTLVAEPDVLQDDLADCSHCAETLSTDTARTALCRTNAAPSSARILNTLVDCACYDKCIVECGSYCAGAKQEPTCQLCILQGCSEPLDACFGDIRK